MKFAKLFAAVMGLMTLMTACQEPVESINPKGMAISVSAQMYNFTRATDTAFEEGDEIGLHIVIPQGAYLNNEKYTYTEGALVAARENVWYGDERLEANVLAYYPYDALAGYREGGYTFTVEADQNNGGYAASDLLVASTTSKPTKEAVVLPFKHALSKIVINIASELEEEIKDVMFADVYGSAVVNFVDGTSAVNGQKGTIKAAKIDADTWTLITVPQSEATPRILVVVGDKQYNFNIAAATDFGAGKMATANLTLTRELIGAEFSAEITDWTADSELQFNPSNENLGGDEEEPEVPEVPEFVAEPSDLGVVGSFEASGWASDALLMTTPTEGLLVAKGVEFAAYDAFKIRTAGVWGGVNVGRSADAVNYIKANHYIPVVNNSDSADITVEAAGTYDIYFNQTAMVVYVMVAGVDIATATKQTANGEEPKVEEPEVTDNTLYFAPNANWKTDGARFAAYFFGDGDAWVSMTDADGDGIYEVNIPVGGYTSVIFCRMNPGAAANNWNNKWNQTGDLVIPTDGKNLYTLTGGEWDSVTGAWSTK